MNVIVTRRSTSGRSTSGRITSRRITSRRITSRRITSRRIATGRTVRAGLALAGMLAVGTGCAGASGTNSAGEPLTEITYRGPFVTSGADAPYYYARKLGHYEAEGIDLRIRDSKGSSQTINDVSGGGAQFGMAAATNVMLSVSRGQPVTAVATPLGRSSFGFFVPESSGIASIKNLKGRTIVVSAAVEPVMYAALSAAGLAKTDVRPVVADANALVTTYLSGKVDAMYTARHFTSLVGARPSTVLMQSDVGLNPPDYVLVAKPDTLASRPEMVRGFVRATLRGFQEAKKDPEAALDALLAEHPTLHRERALATLRSTLDFMCAPSQNGEPYGANVTGDWTATAEALRRFAGLEGATEGTRFFDNRLFDSSEGGGDVAGTC
ncbi:ABC transporter substrate-binding protein [Actinomadura sp. WMMB 499]|uniref:ABC transporter substrate-binding protein n=1 Tax=Actinomadura sp. WMMB 499 TaxID=1219491 RepID=UPI0012472D40|nr:ABC transporter substrate-binding protein [Actinomadura sp. WMMB 499]QFG21342.1 ABC transporter substrate-binding protein [Actinomadura sp. WMMB 499]